MRFAVATLCDYAQIREGLLFISSGNVTDIRRDVFPSPLGLFLALTVTGRVPPESVVLSLSVAMREVGTDEELWNVVAEAEFTGDSDSATRALMLPLVVPLHPQSAPRVGEFEVTVRCEIDGRETDSLNLPLRILESIA